MRICNTERARVPWQCRSAKGKSILTQLVTRVRGKGKKVKIPLLFKYSATKALFLTFLARSILAVASIN